MAFELFKKKPEKEKKPAEAAGAAAAAPLPVDYVASLRAQGYTDDQIVAFMQKQGWQPQQVYDALAQAATAAPEPYPSAVGAGVGGVGKGVEETVESVVSEKWAAAKKELDKYRDWSEETNSRMDKMDQALQDLKADVDGLHKAVVAKISEYDKSLLDVGTEIKAMEKVFSKVLPELTGSVQELGRIARGAKKPKKRKKK